MPLQRAAISLGLASLAAATIVAAASGRGSATPERRTALEPVVVEHVGFLLDDRFDDAWARIHPADRRAVGRSLWEWCKISPEGSLTEVRYLSVDVVRARTVRFSSQLHRRIRAVAVTVEVRALLSGVPLDVRDVSHWVMASGRWSRLVEQRKLAAYEAGRCPSA